MITVCNKQLYEINKKEWVLILYDASSNHYVGVPVYSNYIKESMYIKSIGKYILINSIKDYSQSNITKPIYEKGKVLKISEKEYDEILGRCKVSLLKYLKMNVKKTMDGISYLKWCRDKYNICELNIMPHKLKQCGIYWVNLGYNVGSELRKLRPVILWRSTGDKKIWTMIPLTTKKRKDNYYFHYDLECLTEGSAKIENMMNYSYKRIIAPYFSKNKLVMLTSNDYKKIKKIIEKYYLFNNSINNICNLSSEFDN